MTSCGSCSPPGAPSGATSHATNTRCVGWRPIRTHRRCSAATRWCATSTSSTGCSRCPRMTHCGCPSPNASPSGESSPGLGLVLDLEQGPIQVVVGAVRVGGQRAHPAAVSDVAGDERVVVLGGPADGALAGAAGVLTAGDAGPVGVEELLVGLVGLVEVTSAGVGAVLGQPVHVVHRVPVGQRVEVTGDGDGLPLGPDLVVQQGTDLRRLCLPGVVLPEV